MSDLFFTQCGEKLYMKYEHMNFEHDKRIRTWFELQEWERSLWDKLAVQFVQQIADHFEETFDPDEEENTIADVVSVAVKNLDQPVDETISEK